MSHWSHLSTEEMLVALRQNPDPRLRAEIIERQEPLVRALARKFLRPSVQLEDLVQCGWIALIGAVDRFDPSHGTKFSTYAVHCMVGEIKRYFRDKTWSVKVPRYLQELSQAATAMEETLYRELRREPTVEEIAARLGVREEEILQAMEVGRAYQPANLDDRPVGADGQDAYSLADTLGAPDAELEGIVENAALNQALSLLDDRRQWILRQRFFYSRSQQDLADELGISQMHVSRLERSGLQKLRQYLVVPTAV
jgi:RNA polymerase sigma-B factor